MTGAIFRAVQQADYTGTQVQLPTALNKFVKTKLKETPNYK